MAHRVGTLSRFGVRQAFEHRFTTARMASDYVKAYEALLARNDLVRPPLIAAE